MINLAQKDSRNKSQNKTPRENSLNPIFSSKNYLSSIQKKYSNKHRSDVKENMDKPKHSKTKSTLKYSKSTARNIEGQTKPLSIANRFGFGTKTKTMHLAGKEMQVSPSAKKFAKKFNNPPRKILNLDTDRSKATTSRSQRNSVKTGSDKEEKRCNTDRLINIKHDQDSGRGSSRYNRDDAKTSYTPKCARSNFQQYKKATKTHKPVKKINVDLESFQNTYMHEDFDELVVDKQTSSELSGSSMTEFNVFESLPGSEIDDSVAERPAVEAITAPTKDQRLKTRLNLLFT